MSRRGPGEPPVDGGLVVVDKPGGMTSHDVVARIRRLAATRRVGHAGTLDPMATGVLICGVGRATRLLGHLQLAEKEYAATVRLGQATSTDDAEGELVAAAGAAGIARDAIERGVRALTGPVSQVPSSVSAIKVGGKRAYARVREGEEVELAARDVTVSRFDVLDVREASAAGIAVVDLDVVVTCSSGTYIRALARDLGAGLGCGGHLTALRRTRVGGFGLDVARTLDEHAEELALIPLDAAVAGTFARRDVDEDVAEQLRHGRPIPASGVSGPVGVFGPDGRVIAIVQDDSRGDGRSARPLVVLRPA
jgi:tRNA pseudouridine55 synthase